MSLNLKELCRLMEIDTRPIGVYDAPDPTAFTPVVASGDASLIIITTGRTARPWRFLDAHEGVRDAAIG